MLPERVVAEEENEVTESTETEEVIEETESAEDQESKSDLEEVETAPIDMAEKPENLHLFTVSMDIASPNYEQFQVLLKEIEKKERIMMVTRLEFDKPAESEMMLGDEVDESIIATIDITTFYFEEE
ncbi:hypothetical protein CV093_13235 [Oceanobacillus sp. 143]|nr:hypothetical protein CV093_13235 [Oceanobacillus sp. 143]